MASSFTQVPPDYKLAWVAGLLDGEGSISYYNKSRPWLKKGAWCLKIAISNTHHETLTEIQKIIGFGSISEHSPRKGQTRKVYDYRVEARSGEDFLKLVQPFSITKKVQIELALQARYVQKNTPRIKPVDGNGAARISTEVHERLKMYGENIKRANHHKELVPIEEPVMSHG